MTMSSIGAPSSAFPRSVGAPALALLALTSLHHVYGAVIYGTPWRLHIVYAAVPAAIVLVALLWTASRTTEPRRSWWTAVSALLILAFPVAMIGVYEGGYNHFVKNLVYFGFGETAARALFPGPEYVMPNDLLFEATGIAQLVLGLFAGKLALSALHGAVRRESKGARISPR